MVAYLAIVISKLLGALYSIPFYSMVGEKGGVIYSCAYNIYALFLDISTCGIPIAVSIVISEYNAKGMYRSKERTYSIAMKAVSTISLLSFVLLQLFAKQIGAYFMDDMTEGVTPEQVANGVRAVSTCLLIAPALSLKRGYLQGHKFLTPTSTSQVIEQFVRIAVVLGGAFFAMNVLGLSYDWAVNIALTGAAVGALVAYFYLNHKHKKNQAMFPKEDEEGKALATKREIARKIGTYCLTIVIVSVANSVYSIVDMKMLLSGLHSIGYSDQQTQVIASISSTWIPKICMMITALSMGLTTSIAPHMAESRAKGDIAGANKTLNQAVSALLLISVPMAVGIMVLSEPVFRLFYGYSDFGPGILRLAVNVTVTGCLATTIGMSMQSMQRGKMVCVATLCGIIVNTSMDLPLIYLFHHLGLPAYLGATVSSIIGQSLNVLILLLSLRRSYQFSFMPILKNLLRMLPALAAMFGVVWGLGQIWPAVEGRGILFVMQLAAYAVVGALTYLVCAWFTGAIQGALGESMTAKIKGKLHL